MAWLLALMMFLAPALGWPNEELLQDTLKSIIVSFSALLAAGLLCWQMRNRREPLRWHPVLWLPLALMAYALGSMAWSHAYLAGVEAVRWFVFAVLLWVGLNTLSQKNLPLLAWGIHAGAAVASLWAALQFWAEWSFFAQGPPPASTFVNRNFFAEFAVCTLPFGALLLARARRSSAIGLLAASLGLVIVAILMTGTRAALLALWVQVLVVLPLLAWRCRGQLAIAGWSRGLRVLAAATLLATVAGLGLIPSGNGKILAEGRGTTALERGFKRTQSIHPADSSLAVRMLMWRATLRVIEARPLGGVGAGAWENDVPLYQEPGAQLETDYYVHNEFLQLIAEYGLVGWAFLLALSAWLLRCAWRAWRAPGGREDGDLPWRAVALASLLVLFIVSNIGFPWRMAATGALFALCLAILAATEAAQPLRWSPLIAKGALAATGLCLALAAFITQRAVEAESKIVQATRIAYTISASGTPNDPKWFAARREMLALLREGVAINPHYRKITPLVADELASWGDWRNATWIWESVLSSRPNIVAILCNAARGHASTGDPAKAWAYLEKARSIQPRAPAVQSLEVILLARAGKTDKALQLAHEALAQGNYDYDLINAAFILAWRAGDTAMVLRTMEVRMARWPNTRAQGYVQLGTYYATELRDEQKALDSFRRGLAEMSPEQRLAMRSQIPPQYHQALGYQMSSSSK
ncbi:MAG: O-antigen ligase family protein [Burkholderiales bacterium]|nr:O-antigen ligase family protein [Burkholderiales bacterium]